jgi:arginine decarboxylase
MTAVLAPPTPTPSSAWRIRRDAWEHLGYALAHGDRRSPAVGRLLSLLDSLEPYWAVPGLSTLATIRDLIERDEHADALAVVERVNEVFLRHRIRPSSDATAADGGAEPGPDPATATIVEVLVIDDQADAQQERFRELLLAQRRSSDAFAYEINFVPSAEDAIAALVLNPNIQACVLTPRFAKRSSRLLTDSLRQFIGARVGTRVDATDPARRILGLAAVIGDLRPELDVYLLAGVALESLAGTLTRRFRRIFGRRDLVDLHSAIVQGIEARYETPFFTALQNHSRSPIGVFHAMPISRAGSVHDSPWVNDLEEFYGINLLLAETSATSGELDSLLEPHGSIRQAHVSAARAFNSHRTYFVTNGTSTANKIVHQALIAPGDIVLIDRNCHKSHHYSLVLAGAQVSYLDAYPLEEHAIYGAVPIESITRRLHEFRREGVLDRVKMITLTNCTFDGIVYDPRRVMEACLAIKPDLVFLWDEAWFAFAAAHPVYRRRTAMQAARELAQSLQGHAPEGRPRVRVYATQSMHKTLTSLRQGSMIHVYDEDFTSSRDAFNEAYMTHTSTSPNYQIVASLDIGRRQLELEGYGLVQRQVELALSVRDAVARHPLLRRYFRILTTDDLVPREFRTTRDPNPARHGLAAWDRAWRDDEFVVDPSRLTLDISATGVDGDTFRHTYLMDGHQIQVNKTSRTSVLLMTNIGTLRSSVAYLIEVLVKIAEKLDAEGPRRRETPPPALPLPGFSRFAERFRGSAGAGDIRTAYYASYDRDACIHLSSAQVRAALDDGAEVVSAGFVTPYPPGFPVLVPGQVFTTDILDFMDKLDTREIHGFDASLGYKVFALEA